MQCNAYALAVSLQWLALFPPISPPRTHHPAGEHTLSIGKSRETIPPNDVLPCERMPPCGAEDAGILSLATRGERQQTTATQRAPSHPDGGAETAQDAALA